MGSVAILARFLAVVIESFVSMLRALSLEVGSDVCQIWTLGTCDYLIYVKRVVKQKKQFELLSFELEEKTNQVDQSKE